ncbi:hypothetical protein [Veronia pacifica]|uniref:START domain-containing protein n=1 Tax=Veronia pacifica TaxID=1080227 RepID=A0A1C3ED10_9GAMM|nr:hypothetical protein [Veronia pacifica]ODA31128.1 hypothetical protein A8L45_18310 [Veronia pacifica]
MKLRNYLRALTLSFTILFAFSSHAETLKASDGKEYSSKLKLVSETLDGDKYATVTGRALLKGQLGAPITVTVTTDRLLEWVHDLNYAEVLKIDAPNDQTLYMRFNAPLTLDDRDGYVRFVGSQEGDNVFIMTLVEQTNYPENPDAVRATDFRGQFRIEQVTEDRMALEFKLHYNPHASPVFAANSNTKQIVKKTMKKFKKLTEGEFKDAEIPMDLAQALAAK